MSSPPEKRVKAFQEYRWEFTLIGVLLAVIFVLTLVTHLAGRPESQDHPPSVGAMASPPLTLQPAPSHPLAASTEQASGPPKVIIGPTSISGEFILLTINRKAVTPTSDKLTLRLRVVSHAVADLVTPFQSNMLEVRSPGGEPISPNHPFSYPIQAGNSRDEDIIFIIPSDLSLKDSALRIQYYPEVREIPLSPSR